MFSKRLPAFLLACCALFPLPGCETEDDRYFNSLVAERKSQLSLEEEGPWRYLAGPYPLTNSKGELGIVAQESFLLPASMQNKELAWEFIKYCVGEREEPRICGEGPIHNYTRYFPTNRYNLGTMAEDVTNDEGLGSTNAPFDTGIYGMDPQIYLDAVEDLFTGPLAPLEYYDQIHIQEFIDEMILHRLTTPEECAEKIQGRVTSKLNE